MKEDITATIAQANEAEATFCVEPFNSSADFRACRSDLWATTATAGAAWSAAKSAAATRGAEATIIIEVGRLTAKVAVKSAAA
ncbi:hypothetical protein AA15669_1496 [Saccharibacter floricola DSM 15669]|uniref:Uncharacterized protein n=1 Tax=Saccharibacter floricola DSM 15669 TaxID=1123227 RepID=A0ABQ0NZW4_9PROT|nr:hypothetical protein AA15669_1496 [Saccharibacter floricola DSM 15669]